MKIEESWKVLTIQNGRISWILTALKDRVLGVAASGPGGLSELRKASLANEVGFGLIRVIGRDSENGAGVLNYVGLILLDNEGESRAESDVQTVRDAFPNIKYWLTVNDKASMSPASIVQDLLDAGAIEKYWSYDFGGLEEVRRDMLKSKTQSSQSDISAPAVEPETETSNVSQASVVMVFEPTGQQLRLRKKLFHTRLTEELRVLVGPGVTDPNKEEPEGDGELKGTQYWDLEAEARTGLANKVLGNLLMEFSPYKGKDYKWLLETTHDMMSGGRTVVATQSNEISALAFTCYINFYGAMENIEVAPVQSSCTIM